MDLLYTKKPRHETEEVDAILFAMNRLERDLRQHWLEQWRKFALPLERLLHNRVLELVQYRLKSVIKHLLQVCEYIVA